MLCGPMRGLKILVYKTWIKLLHTAPNWDIEFIPVFDYFLAIFKRYIKQPSASNDLTWNKLTIITMDIVNLVCHNKYCLVSYFIKTSSRWDAARLYVKANQNIWTKRSNEHRIVYMKGITTSLMQSPSLFQCL